MKTDPDDAMRRRYRLIGLCGTRGQKQVSDATGISLSQIGQWLTGARNMTDASGKKIAGKLGLPRNYFDRDESVPSPNVPALTEEIRRLLDIWARLSKNQRVALMDQLQATAASNIEIAEHLRGLGIKGVVPDDEVERKLLNGAAPVGAKKGRK